MPTTWTVVLLLAVTVTLAVTVEPDTEAVSPLAL